MSRVLFMSCSQRKRQGGTVLPATERYDGPLFRVLRRYQRSAPPQPPAVWVLSGEYGLIRGEMPVHDYDTRMTFCRANELRKSVLRQFTLLARTGPPSEAFVCLGRAYAHAMSDCWRLLPPCTRLRFARGSIGARASQLRDWLYGGTPPVLAPSVSETEGCAVLLGNSVRATPQQVLEVARKGILQTPSEMSRFEVWYVPVGGARVAPKWLVSRLTGLPVSRFRTSDALRVLTQLGVAVVRA